MVTPTTGKRNRSPTPSPKRQGPLNQSRSPVSGRSHVDKEEKKLLEEVEEEISSKINEAFFVNYGLPTTKEKFASEQDKSNFLDLQLKAVRGAQEQLRKKRKVEEVILALSKESCLPLIRGPHESIAQEETTSQKWDEIKERDKEGKLNSDIDTPHELGGEPKTGTPPQWIEAAAEKKREQESEAVGASESKKVQGDPRSAALPQPLALRDGPKGKRDVYDPTKDIVCSRGNPKGPLSDADKKYRTTIAENAQEYHTLSVRREKTEFITNIINALQEEGFRFKILDKNNQTCEELSPVFVREKVVKSFIISFKKEKRRE